MATEYFGSTVGACSDVLGTTSGKSSLNYYSRYLGQANEASIFRNTLINENSAKTGTLERQMRNFKAYMEDGQEDEALAAYQKLLTEMAKQEEFANLDEEGLKVRAEQLLEGYLSDKAGEDVELTKYITKYAANASEQSKQKTWFNNGKIDETTEEDLLKEICDIDKEKHVSGGRKFLNFIDNTLLLPFKLIAEGCDALFGPDHH